MDRRKDFINKFTNIINECEPRCISTPIGWEKIVDNLFETWAKLLNGRKINVLQIKEKFFSLRVYYCLVDYDKEKDKELNESLEIELRKAEQLSYNACVGCGDSTEKVEGAWFTGYGEHSTGRCEEHTGVDLWKLMQ